MAMRHFDHFVRILVIPVVLIVLPFWGTSCEKQQTNTTLTAVENSVGILQLESAFYALFTAFTENTVPEIIGENLPITRLDSTQSGGYAVWEINFGSGWECADGFRRSGIWQLQLNNNNPELADSGWLFLQQSFSDTSQLNSGLGWKGEQLKLLGSVGWNKQSSFLNTHAISVEFRGRNFQMKTDVHAIYQSATQTNSKRVLSESIKGKIRYFGAEIMTAEISSSTIARDFQCAKSYQQGQLSLMVSGINTAIEYTVNFNPFGANPSPCDEHAKLEQGKIEKMFTLW